MSSTEAKYSVTVKTPRGNLVTVRGDTGVEWKRNLEEASASGALAAISQIEASLSGRPAAPAQPKAEQPAVASQDQQLPDSIAAVPCKVCGGETSVERKVSPKDQNTYDIFTCKASQLHKPTFIKV